MKTFCHIIFLALFIYTVSSCKNEQQSTVTHKLEYSEFLRISDTDKDITVVEITNPWDTARLLHRYILIPKGTDMPEGLPKGTVVRTPIDKIVVYSSVHASIIEELGASESIIGVCEPEYIVSPSLQQKIASGDILDCGRTMSPNIERIINCGTQIIIASPFENSSYGTVEKTGIPIIEGADYMENTPLGRAEWIRFFGALLNRKEQGDSVFTSIRDHYNTLRDSVADYLQKSNGAIKRPTLLAERRYGSSWDVPNSDSYMVRIYEDAGAQYLFDYLKGTGSTNMSFEKVYQIGAKADFWIFKYWKESNEPMTYGDLEAEYALYSQFEAFKNQKIYGCNTATTSYYDDILLHPDAVLKDFIFIFHPEVLGNGYEPKYFLPLALSR